MLTYNECVNLMRNARLGRRKLANNTYLEEVCGEFAVRLHGTYVVTIHQDGTYTLNTGGWYTVTTKDRINLYSPARVWQDRHVWYVQDGHNKPVEFFDGIKVNSDGLPVNLPDFVADSVRTELVA